MKWSFSKKAILVIFTLVLFSIGGYIAHQRTTYNLLSTQEIKEARLKLSALTPDERKDLTAFIENAILFSSYSYTLVDAKPMSLFGNVEWSDDLPPIFKSDYQNPRLMNFYNSIARGCRVFEKYHLAPHKSYRMISFHDSESYGLKRILIVQESLCKKLIDQYINDFHEILGEPFTVEEIFHILTHPEHALFYQIIDQDRLFGILLGYGRDNAFLFEHNIRDKLDFFTNEWPYFPRKWCLPDFVCDSNSDETKELKQRYIRARKFIRWTYFGRNDLEVTLALLQR